MPQSEMAPEPMNVEPMGHGCPVVLVADDERSIRLLVGECLKDDFDLRPAGSGEEALAIADREQVDLILLDIVMPGMDGYETCRRLKASERARDIPIIFLSSLHKPETEELGFAVGAVDFLSKPFTPSLLRARVSTHIQLYRTQRALALHALQMEQRVEERTRALTEAHEAQRRESEEKVRLATEAASLVQLAPFGIAHLRRRQFVRVNEAFNRMLGYRGDELIGRSTRAIYCSDQQFDQIGRDAYEPIRRGESVKFETELLTKQGRKIWALAGTCSTNPDDPQADVLYIIQDITEHRMLETRLAEAAERTRVLSLAKSEFMSVISHELRTPLNGILGMAQLLKTLVAEAEQEYVEAVLESGQNLLAIINQIVHFTSIDARPIEETLETISVFVLIALRADAYMVKAQQKGLSFELRIGDEFQNDVRIDAHSMETLLDILLDNALKFTDVGKISLDADLETTGDNEDFLVCSIADTGVGMGPETLQRLFTPFYQGEDAITRKHGGVGLGLAMARKLIDRLGGSIAVESEWGKGSTFRFRIPLSN